MSGRKTFTAGEVLQAADVNDYLMDQSVMVFAGTAARGSAIPSPTEGMVTYRSDDDIVEVYDGSSWNTVGPGQILQVVSSTALHTQTDFTTGTYTASEVEASITPSSTSSKVMVFVTTPQQSYNTISGLSRFDWRLYRNGSAIGTDPLIKSLILTGFFDYQSSNSFLDSPNSTSALTYNLRYKRDGGSSTLRIGSGSPYSITLMEVAG